jgi:DNA-binding winged helix-turn-helix (wHTH) protein/TolB-like protein
VSSVRFGLFELDTASGTLTREGTPVRLQPQPARVLTLLVGRAGELVTRDELRTAIWGDATYVDFERGLNFCIAQIRGALGDSADSPRFVETLPRRGYRFIAPVHQPAARNSRPVDRAASDGGAGPAGSGRPRTPWVALAVALLLLVAGAAASVLRLPAAGRAPIRVAVVPFDNETGSTEYDRIAGGVADATVARLAAADRLERVAVIGNAAVLRRPRAFRDLKAIGEELRADYVVLAQVKSDGGRVRLIAHLIRVSDEAHVWANTFDRPSFSLDVQSELAEAIAQSVVDRLKPR